MSQQVETMANIAPQITIVEGDLLDQEVDVIVNAWIGTSSRGGCCCRREFLGPLNDGEERFHFEKWPDTVPFPWEVRF